MQCFWSSSMSRTEDGQCSPLWWWWAQNKPRLYLLVTSNTVNNYIDRFVMHVQCSLEYITTLLCTHNWRHIWKHRKPVAGRKAYQVDIKIGAMFIVINVTAVHRTMTHCDNPWMFRTIFRLVSFLLHKICHCIDDGT